MLTVRQRAKYYVVLITTVILVCSVAYDYGMKAFEPGQYPPEGVKFSLLYSAQFVVETFTATGYGSHSPWTSTEMQVLVMILDVTGVAVFFLALPAVFIPVFRKMLSPSVPREVDKGLEDHVVISTYTPRAEALIQELRANGVGYVLVEPDRAEADDLQENGWEVVNADPESVAGLKSANVSDARAVVADVSDQVDASIVLAAKEATEDVKVVSVVEDPDLAEYHKLAGADVVLRPREQIGRSLAAKVTTGVRADDDAISIGDDLEIAEIPIHRGSELADKTLAQSGIREKYGVNVVGAWYKGEFQTPPDPGVELDRGTVLLVTGAEEDLRAIKREMFSTVREFKRGETVLVGYGEGGRTVAEKLDDSDLPYTVVDQKDREGVDVVGDATDPEVLRDAGVPDARSVVLMLPDDTTTEFTTLITRDMSDSVEIVARARKSGAVGKTYRAGAEYVLSSETISGRSVASEVLDEEVLSVGTNVDVVRTAAAGLVGETLEGAQVRKRTGCTVVAVERDSEILTGLPPDFRIRDSDRLVIAGTDEGTNGFVEMFG